MNLLQVSNLTFELEAASRSSGVIVLKSLMFPLVWVLGLRHVKTPCKKSLSVNYLQMSNLTCDPCFKVSLSYRTKMALYLPYYWSMDAEFCFKVMLLPFLLDTRQEINLGLVFI